MLYNEKVGAVGVEWHTAFHIYIIVIYGEPKLVPVINVHVVRISNFTPHSILCTVSFNSIVLQNYANPRLKCASNKIYVIVET